MSELVIDKPKLDDKKLFAEEQISPETAIAILDWANVTNWRKLYKNISAKNLHATLAPYFSRKLLFTWSAAVGDTRLDKEIIESKLRDYQVDVPLSFTEEELIRFLHNPKNTGALSLDYEFKDKIERAHLIMENQITNEALQRMGFELVCKEVMLFRSRIRATLLEVKAGNKVVGENFRRGKLVKKANVDSDIVVKVLDPDERMLDRYEHFLFASGDGDFMPLYQVLLRKEKQLIVLATRNDISKRVCALAESNPGQMKLKFAEDTDEIWHLY